MFTVFKIPSLLLFLAFLLAGCSAPPPEMDTLKVASANQPSNALTFIAQEKHFFKDENLDVVFKSFPSGKRALDDGFLLPEKQFDLAITSDMPFSNKVFDGIPLVTFAHIYSTNNLNRIVARKDRGILKFEDLAGHTIGTQQDSAVHYFLHQVLNAYGLNDKNVTTVFIPAEKLPLALKEGTIDAFSMREPYISQAKNLLGGNAIILQSYGLYRQYDLLVSTVDKIHNKERAFKKFVKALLKAQAYAIEHPQEAINITAKYLKIQPKALKQNWSENALKIGLQQGLLLTLEKQERWLATQNNALNNRQPKNYTDYFYFPILDSIAPELVAVIHEHNNEALTKVPNNKGAH